MALQKLTLVSVKNLDPGGALAVEKLLSRAALDCIDRPADNAARKVTLEFELETMHRLLPHATWTAAGIGVNQLTLNHWALELGGHIRTGLEDNIRWDKNRLAASNAELVARAADLVGQYNRRVATPAEARALLGLRAIQEQAA